MADYLEEGLRKIGITISKPLLATVCIVFGIIVIAFPNLLVWTVGLFMMIQGTLLFTDYFEQGSQATIVSAVNAVHCGSCGVRNREESTYCKICGERLTQTEQIIAPQTERAEPAESVEQAETVVKTEAVEHI